MRRSVSRLALVALVVAAVTVTGLPFVAGAGRTRPRGSAAEPAGGPAAAVSGQVSRGSAPTRVSGKATYGYYGTVYGYPYYPSSYWWYWGWPYSYAYWGYWGWPYYYGYYPASARPRLQTDPAVVETDVRPKKADVVLDGAPVGQARDYNGSWDVLVVKPGLHALEFRHPGYMTLRVYLDAAAGGHYRIADRLERGEGLDPRSMERPPDRAEEPAGRRIRGTVPEESGREALAQGLLRISASPPDAAVYLDGEFLARADELARMHGALPVAVGRHVIEVVRPGFEGRSVDVQVDANEPAKVSIDLSPR